MQVELIKEDLINLVKSISPAKPLTEKKGTDTFSNIHNNMGLGTYLRGYGWLWKLETLEKLEEKDLLAIYHACKLSWKL